MDVLSTLYRAVEQGFLLHGSPVKTSVLSPRKANDLEKKEGNQEAVYATINVLVAVLSGLLHRKLFGPFMTQWSGSSEHLDAYGENVELRDGYVYILRPDTFRVVHTDDGEESNEYASPVAVEPLEAIEVTSYLLPMLNITLELR